MNINNVSSQPFVNTDTINSSITPTKSDISDNSILAFTPAAKNAFAHNTNHSDTAGLLEALKQLISSFGGGNVTSSAEKNNAAYADSIQDTNFSNMSTKQEPSLSRLNVHNEIGTSQSKADGLTDSSFNESSSGEQTFTLRAGLTMPRGNGGDDHSRVEAFTRDNWSPADDKTHTFSANYLVGRIDDDMAVFQIKESGAAFPAITARLREDPSRGFRLDIVGTNPDSDSDKRIALGSYTIGAKDGVSPPEPKQFSITASDDGDDWEISVKQGGNDLFARLDPDNEASSINSNLVSKTLTGEHLNRNPEDDSVAFRWGLYSNSPQPTGFESTSKVNNIKISSKDGGL